MESLLMYILLIHFLADFGLQTHDQAMKKSTSSRFLCYHVGVYSTIWLLATIPILGWYSLLFGLITFICHYLTDFITSRIGKSFWEARDMHNGFVVVGFDQILHYIQLYLTFKLLL